MKRLCLWGEFSPTAVDNTNVPNVNHQDEFTAAYANSDNIKKPKFPEVVNPNDYMKVQMQTDNGSGKPECVEITNRIDMIKTLIDNYARKKLGSDTIMTRMLLQTSENTFEFTTDGKTPSPPKAKSYPQYTASRASLRRVTCGLLKLSGYTEVSYTALIMLTDAIDSFLKNFFEKMQAALPQPMSTPKRIPYPNPVPPEDMDVDPIPTYHFQDGTIGTGGEESAEIKELRAGYTFMGDGIKNCGLNGSVTSGIASGCDASAIAGGCNVSGMASGYNASTNAGGCSASGMASGYDTSGMGNGCNASGMASGYDASGMASGYDASGMGSGCNASGMASGYDASGMGSGYDASGMGSGYNTSGMASGYDPSGMGSGCNASGMASGCNASGMASGCNASGMASGYDASGMGSGYDPSGMASGCNASGMGSGYDASGIAAPTPSTSGKNSILMAQIDPRYASCVAALFVGGVIDDVAMSSTNNVGGNAQ